MPFYIGDYLRDTRRLSTLEHGAYLLLIMEYWQQGGLPDDDSRLARIAGISLSEWKPVRAALAPYFMTGWRHKRVEDELEKSKEKHEKAKASADARWKDKPSHHRKHNNTDANGSANAHSNGSANGSAEACANKMLFTTTTTSLPSQEEDKQLGVVDTLAGVVAIPTRGERR